MRICIYSKHADAKLQPKIIKKIWTARQMAADGMQARVHSA
jgi:hypothetical protein